MPRVLPAAVLAIVFFSSTVLCQIWVSFNKSAPKMYKHPANTPMNCLMLHYNYLSKVDSCYEKADIIFVLGSSENIGLDNFQKLLQFVATFTNRFVFGQARFSVIKFENTATIALGFNAYNDSTTMKNAVLNIPLPVGGVDMASALRLARKAAFNTTIGARPEVPKIAIVCTDEQIKNPNETETEAQNLKNYNVLVISIGIGISISKDEIEKIASSPDDAFVVIDYSKILPIIFDYIAQKCRVDN